MTFDPPDDLELELIESEDDVGVARAGGGTGNPDALELSFSGELWYWRGPAPYHFVTAPRDAASAIQAVAAKVTYGWGMVPVRVRIGNSVWATALWPKDGGYVVPIKDAFRKSEGLALGDVVAVQLTVRR
jgi:Domain of unknown function (DUF1905)